MAVGITYTGVVVNGGSFTVGSGQFDITKECIGIQCILNLTGSYGTGSSNGDPVLFDAVQPPIGASLYGNAPSRWEFQEIAAAGTALTGYIFNYQPDSLTAPTQNGGVLSAYLAGVQYTAGSAYSGGLPSGTKVLATFWFARNGN